MDQLQVGKYDFDDDIIETTRQDKQPRVKIYRHSKPLVVMGVGSKPDLELYVDNCVKDRIKVLRRRGGGCAVVIDPGNVVVSMVLPIGGLQGITQFFNWLSLLLLAGLAEIGIPNVKRIGISDIVITDRKVAGACLWCSKNILYYSATLLVQPQIELIERYLKHPPKEPPYRRHRPHRDFIGSLNTTPVPKTPAQIARELKKVLTTEDLESLIEASE